MLDNALARIVAFCVRFPALIVGSALLLAIGSGIYVAGNFAVNTDVSRLLSPDLAWRQREIVYRKSFPQQSESIIAVVDADIPEHAAAAARALVERLQGNRTLFRSVRDAGADPFFRRNALLFLDNDQLNARLGRLGGAAPLLRILGPDRNLRGLASTLSAGLRGLQAGQYKLDDMTVTLNMAADTVDSVLGGQPKTFSWINLLNRGPVQPSDARRIIEIVPVLDYSALEPGKVATTAVRKAADDLNLATTYQARMRLTGPVPIADEEFASLQQGAALNGVLSAAIVLVILWLALRSWRLVIPVGATVGIGLAVTAALGTWMVGALNPISVAFAVLFVGLGADFAIQYSVRHRAERHEIGDLAPALVSAARNVGTPLTLAAAAAAVGFLSFLPTAYRGLAELGLIGGCGMLVAFIAAMTLLPALLAWFNPPPETQPLGYARLAVADSLLKRHRIAVVAVTSLVVLAGAPALTHLKFDFDPLSLRDPHAEPIATMRELGSDPKIGPDSAQLLTTREDAAALRPELAALPQVASVRSIDDFVPADQDRKLRAIGGVARTIEQAVRGRARPAPNEGESIGALRQAVQELRGAAGDGSGTGAVAARRLADGLIRLADGAPDQRKQAETAFTSTLGASIDDLKMSLQPQKISSDHLPAELVRDWTAPNQQIRVQITPKGDANDSENVRRFARAVLAVAPNATGPAIEVYEWGRTIIVAFAESGAYALVAIALLLWIVLRRFSDVMLTLIPLLVAAAATLEICALTGFALNYANIIALPVLLGVGVAFKIYYVLAWRKGETNFLQSPLTRAVFFSALMTATAFGSLWLSSHPGTSSMGKLLALSLICTLASAALFQPALMGEPRKAKADDGATDEPPSARRKLDMRGVGLAVPRVWSRETLNRRVWDRIRHRSGSQS
jgi:hopanoid biosynthesis associated RND transporter like protein HpnN